jgi:hypothetical protein
VSLWDPDPNDPCPPICELEPDIDPSQWQKIEQWVRKYARDDSFDDSEWDEPDPEPLV